MFSVVHVWPDGGSPSDVPPSIGVALGTAWPADDPFPSPDDPLPSTGVPVPLNEHDSLVVAKIAESGQSSTSVQPAGAVTGTPPIDVVRSGSPFPRPGITARCRASPIAAAATPAATRHASTPVTTVPTCRRRPR